MELLEALKWRYATKKMNGQKVPEKDISTIIEAAHLAPTSSGVQPFEIFVITNRELLEKIHGIANHQSQVVDCSHLLIFAAWTKYTPERIKSVFSQLTRERSLPDNQMDAYFERLINHYESQTEEQHFQHAARQAYIAFTMAIAAAAELKIDATPMEGFDNYALDHLLELEAKGLKSAVILPVGYRDAENDWLVNMKKIRRPKELYIHEIK